MHGSTPKGAAGAPSFLQCIDLDIGFLQDLVHDYLHMQFRILFLQQIGYLFWLALATSKEPLPSPAPDFYYV